MVLTPLQRPPIPRRRPCHCCSCFGSQTAEEARVLALAGRLLLVLLLLILRSCRRWARICRWSGPISTSFLCRYQIVMLLGLSRPILEASRVNCFHLASAAVVGDLLLLLALEEEEAAAEVAVPPWSMCLLLVVLLGVPVVPLSAGRSGSRTW